MALAKPSLGRAAGRFLRRGDGTESLDLDQVFADPASRLDASESATSLLACRDTGSRLSCARATRNHPPQSALQEACRSNQGADFVSRVQGVGGYGVRMTMPDTPANEAEFGRPGASRGTAAFPQMMAIAIVETTSRLIQNIVLGKHDAAERDGCEQMLTKLGLGDLLLMDSGFAAAWLFNLMMTKKIKFLSRIGNTWNPVKIKRLGVGDWLVQVSGPDCSTNEVKSRKSKKE